MKRSQSDFGDDWEYDNWVEKDSHTGKRGNGRYSLISLNYYPGCRHWRQSVRVGSRYILCSSYDSGKDLRQEPVPGYGVYLHSGWKDKQGIFTTNGAYIKALAKRRAYPCLFVDWLDMSIIKPEELDTLVEICVLKMRQGKVLEIACNAGHGRTGTLAACLLARVEHLTADAAIKAIRSRYCVHAVETSTQEESVKKYCERLAYRVGARR